MTYCFHSTIQRTSLDWVKIRSPAAFASITSIKKYRCSSTWGPVPKTNKQQQQKHRRTSYAPSKLSYYFEKNRTKQNKIGLLIWKKSTKITKYNCLTSSFIVEPRNVYNIQGEAAPLAAMLEKSPLLCLTKNEVWLLGYTVNSCWAYGWPVPSDPFLKRCSLATHLCLYLCSALLCPSIYLSEFQVNPGCSVLQCI